MAYPTEPKPYYSLSNYYVQLAIFQYWSEQYPVKYTLPRTPVGFYNHREEDPKSEKKGAFKYSLRPSYWDESTQERYLFQMAVERARAAQPRRS